MYFNFSTIIQRLSKPISFFGIKLWIVILTCIVLFVLVSSLCIIKTRQRRRRKARKALKPLVTKESLLTHNRWEIEMGMRSIPAKQVKFSTSRATRPSYQFTLTEIEAATNDFAEENVVACGDYAIIYHGIMFGNTRVAIKRLLSSRAKAKEFTGEVEVLLGLRHKNLVKLIGYCFEGYYRIIVDEYVDNGNLEHWLHGCISDVSPLTWNIRMNIVLGIAKGLAYLHEDTEPAAIIHQHLKSSSILLDKHWNPKISDFGITNLLGSDESSNYPITSPPGMSGYLAPEYLSTGILDDKSDVYSFGILIMEIVSGKPPTECTTTEIEEYLIDWMKSMVASQQYDQIVDPKLPEMPCMKELKIILLIALRCVDPNVNSRPKMGQVIHMLQPRDLLLSDVNVTPLLHHNFKSINKKECV
ncbi:probable serine/threonine-protein kinase At1g01540 [Solanum dulcamara]|uniref:probable serine/threonine-protein kinase At1g01540 n=1 Tax=Solanum dulcamara TaxID=45834 RepID=UPI00248596B4|nr:probable serine/threonine-protein kinase At1g01540 [Solanum dulcamara]